MIVDRDAMIHGLMLLSENFYKIIEVDLNEDAYFDVKTAETDSPHIYTGVRKWVDAFSEAGVHPEDVERFRKFFDPLMLKQGTDKWQRCYYRRKIDGEWRYVCMEVIPFDNYSEDDALVLILVRDVEDYIKDFHEQVSLSDYDKYYKRLGVDDRKMAHFMDVLTEARTDGINI